jgi:hypothetical protein
MLNRWENIRRQIMDEGLLKKNYKQAFTGVFWLLAVAGALEIGIRRGTDKVLDLLAGDNESDDRSFMEEMARNTADVIPIMGSIINSIIYGTNPMPIIQTEEAGFGGIRTAFTGKEPETRAKGVAKLMGAIGKTLGVPGTTQLEDVIKRGIGKEKSPSIKPPKLPRPPKLPKQPKLPKAPKLQ